MKLKFKLLKEEDIEQVRQWRMKPEITKYMYTDPIITTESQLKWFNKIKDDESITNWIVVVDGVNVGFVSLKTKQIYKWGFWAYYIGDSDYIGKGIGGQIELNLLKYVFDVLNLFKLECEVFQSNDKVIHIHQKYGFKKEGLLRFHIFKNNMFENVVVMGITKREWDQMKNLLEINIAEIEQPEPILAIDYEMEIIGSDATE